MTPIHWKSGMDGSDPDSVFRSQRLAMLNKGCWLRQSGEVIDLSPYSGPALERVLDRERALDENEAGP